MLLSALMASTAMAASLVSVRISNSPQHLRVYAEMEGGVSMKIKEAIHSGIPTTFTYLIEIRRHRRLRPDARVFKTVVRQTVRYDALKKEYKFSTDASGIKKETVEKDFEEVERLLHRLDGVALMPPARLKEGVKYSARAKVEIKSIKLIFPFNYMLFFVSFWDVDTAWKSTPKFTRATIPRRNRSTEKLAP